LLILAGGTLGTARLLMRSREFLPLISNELGKNIAINGSIRVAALLPEWCPDGDMFTGQSHPGMVSYQFFNSHGIMVSACKALPLQIFGTARIMDPDTHRFWGTEHTHLMEKLRRRMIFLDIHGITRPNTILSLNKKGELKMKLEVNHDLLNYNRKAQKIAQDILIRNGCKILNIQYLNGKGVDYKDLHFHSAHQVGSCRMAGNVRDGVVKADGEVFNYPGMYITDGSVIPSSTGVNVSLTILANSERITEKIISTYRHKKLTASL
jgi:choline dehydrogenase-like flavoprotein